MNFVKDQAEKMQRIHLNTHEIKPNIDPNIEHYEWHGLYRVHPLKNKNLNK